MSTPQSNRNAGELSLNEKLHVLRMADSGIVHQAVANQSSTTLQSICEIVQSRQRLRKLKDSPTKRNSLDLNGKLKVIHFKHIQNNAPKVGRICLANPRTVIFC